MNEIPVSLGGEGSLFGIMTSADNAGDVGVIILNSGLLHRVGPYRLHVCLARALAGLRVNSIRLDQSGKGDSPLRLGVTSGDALLLDYDDAAAELRETGASRIVLVGLCSGADDALVIANRRPEVEGVVLLDGYAPITLGYYLHHYLPRMLKISPWLNAFRRLGRRVGSDAQAEPPRDTMLGIRDWSDERSMVARFSEILARDGRILAVFTGGAEEYYNHHKQLTNSLPSSVHVDHLTEVFYSAAEHTYPLAAHRNQLVEEVCRWFSEHWCE